MHDHDAMICGEIDVEVALVLAEVRRPDIAVVAAKGRGDGTPVDEVARVVNDETGSEVEAGVREIEVVAYAQMRMGMRT
jgi:hypothetical protein